MIIYQSADGLQITLPGDNRDGFLAGLQGPYLELGGGVELPVAPRSAWIVDWQTGDITADPDWAAAMSRTTARMPMADFRLALLAAGFLDQVEAFMDGPAATKEQQILWEYSTEVARTDPTLGALALALGFTDEDLDGVFGLG